MTDALIVGEARFAYIVVTDDEGAQAASDDIALDVRFPDDSTDTAMLDDASSDDLDIINALQASNPDWVDLTATTGVYVASVDCDQAGNYWLRWSATDPLLLATQEAFYVYPQRVVLEVVP